MTQTERIARLETTVQTLVDEVRLGRQEIKELRETLDSLTGGKQALMWITGISISIAAVVIGFLNVTKNKG